MDTETKLALFDKYDFSKTGQLERAGISASDPRVKLYHDIAGMIQAIALKLSTVAETTWEDVEEYNRFQHEIYEYYGWLCLRYLGIDWRELDADDSDLAVFFRMKESIADLGHGIDVFLDKVRLSQGGGAESSEYKEVRQQIREIGDLMQEFKKTRERLREQRT
jgi:hypothetical protein